MSVDIILFFSEYSMSGTSLPGFHIIDETEKIGDVELSKLFLSYIKYMFFHFLVLYKIDFLEFGNQEGFM